MRKPAKRRSNKAKDTATHVNVSQAEKAYDLIEEMIVSLKLKPGSRISEKFLSEQLGIGRTPVREALQKLAYEGTVTITPRSGITISEIDMTDQFRLIEVRREMERIMAKRAAQFSTQEERNTFLTLAEEFLKVAPTNDVDRFIPTDRDYNQLLASAARNRYAQMSMNIIQAQTRRFAYLYFAHFGDMKRICELHANISRAIGEGDEKRAGEASDELIDYIEEYTTRTIKSI
ncbi:MAG: GntR family transcriptional regulator [Burkholderiaceae bacterium]|jgi:DNA-binding GntR family transcriptional regulator|nr:GntR family transcriptional regulator [Burkholderiaceae bacterium]